MKVRSGFVSNSSSSSFIIGLPEGTNIENFKELLNMEAFQREYGDISPEDFFRCRFTDDERLQTIRVLEAILDARCADAVYKKCFGTSVNAFFVEYGVPFWDQMTKPIRVIVDEVFSGFDFYLFPVRFDTNVHSVFKKEVRLFQTGAEI